MYRKSSLLILLGSVAAVVIVFLSLVRLPSGTSTPAARGGEPLTPIPLGDSNTSRQHIMVSVSMTGDQFDDLLETTARFMELHPGVSVELDNLEPEQAYEAWKKNAQLGSGADVALMDNRWVSEFAVLGYLKPLDQVVAAMPVQWLNGLIEPVNWNGYWWGLPKDADPYVVVWSLPLLDSLTSTGIPGDWNGFVELAVAAGAARPEVPLVRYKQSDAKQLLAWLDSFSADTDRIELLRPFSMQLQERLKFLDTGEGSAFTIKRDGKGNEADALLAGELLSAVMRWSEVEALPAEQRGLLGIGYPNGWYGGRSYVVFAYSSTKIESIGQWLRYVAGEDEQQAGYDRHRLLPSIKSLYAAHEDAAFGEGGGRKADYAWLKQLDLMPDKLPEPDWPIRMERWDRIWQQLGESDSWLHDLVVRWNGEDAAAS